MAEVTLEYVLALARQLTKSERQSLIAQLQQEAELVEETFHKTFGFIIFQSQVGDLNMTLRREDMYGDDER
ncbi:MAG: hypothetical protein DYG88_16900 [Chloroflexi bacterium CFX4]|nr:hypothetical protein [Chloroflexi bacterium CFX4]MDL1922368.1 hypothetical protein [Chloroflexi bacterium CFX3]